MKRRLTITIFLGTVAVSLLLLSQPAAVSAQSVQTVPVYRFFAPGMGHYYSTSPVPITPGQYTEGISFWVSPVKLSYTVPLFAMQDLEHWDHLYTIDAKEQASAFNIGYKYRGIVGYILPADMDLPGTAPLHRWVGRYKAAGFMAGEVQDHLYAATKPDVPGYTYEGEAARIWTESVKLPQRLIELTAPAAGATIPINTNPAIQWNIWSSGGSIRLSYSTDNGASWSPIATVENNGVYNQVNHQSYNGWKVPPGAGGQIIIRADWVRGGLFGSQRPWATDSKIAIKGPAIRDIRVPPRISRP